jgi:hypothetical protein
MDRIKILRKASELGLRDRDVLDDQTRWLSHEVEDSYKKAGKKSKSNNCGMKVIWDFCTLTCIKHKGC